MKCCPGISGEDSLSIPSFKLYFFIYSPKFRCFCLERFCSQSLSWKHFLRLKALPFLLRIKTISSWFREMPVIFVNCFEFPNFFPDTSSKISFLFFTPSKKSPGTHQTVSYKLTILFKNIKTLF